MTHLHRTIWNERLRRDDPVTIIMDADAPLSTDRAQTGYYVDSYARADGTVMATYRTWMGKDHVLPISHLRAQHGAYTPKVGDIIHVHANTERVSDAARGRYHVVHQAQYFDHCGDVFTIHTIHGDEYIHLEECTLISRNS